MRHVISVLLQNEVGALTRMTGLFSTRGYNIETLNVAPTDDPLVSRVTLVIEGSDAAIAQLNTQLAKLVDVVNIHDMTLGEHFERELAIVKLKLRTGGYEKVRAIAAQHGAEILDDAQISCTVQLTGRPSEVDAFIECRGRSRQACRRCEEWQRGSLQRRNHAVVVCQAPPPDRLAECRNLYSGICAASS